jgi:predicted RNase H-like HicB family nuclease
MEYIAYLHKDKRSDYGVSFPDFTGCVTAGKSLEEARELAVEALTLHIAGMVEDGEALPEPSTLDELARDPAMKGAVAFLVSAEAPEKTVRVNIKAGMTRSAYMVQSAVLGSVREVTRRARASLH